MFNLGPYALWEFAKARHEELLREAQAAHQAHSFRASKAGKLRKQLVWSFGDLMIAFGHWLKARQKPIL